MPRGFVDNDGKTWMEGDPGYVEARVEHLARQHSTLLWTVIELQHRIATIDGKGVESYPGSEYYPDNRPPEFS